MIRIKNVTKDYGSNKGVFDLSFEVQDQETFGLLGMEGAGKTTLVNLLMRFHEIQSGDIKIDGISTRDMKREECQTLLETKYRY